MKARRWAAALGATALLSSAGGLALAGASPPGSLRSDGVTSYAGYPANEVPAGCDSSAVHGVEWHLDGALVDDIRDVTHLELDDTVTMSWTSIDSACAGAVVSLSIKQAHQATFDPSDDQQLLIPYAATTADDGSGSLSLQVSQPATLSCFYQLDAVVGRPLTVVGPNGSFYSGSYGLVERSDERSVLIGASNGTVDGCGEETTTTEGQTTTTDSTPTSSSSTSSTVSTTSSTGVTSTTTVDDSSTTTSSTSGSSTTTSDACVTDSSGVARRPNGQFCSTTTSSPGATEPPPLSVFHPTTTDAARANEESLPVTGSDSARLVEAGVALAGAGLLALGLGRRKQIL